MRSIIGREASSGSRAGITIKIAMVFLVMTAWAATSAVAAYAEGTEPGEDPLAVLTQEIIPAEGMETLYGEELSFELLPRFVQAWYNLVPAAEEDARYREALEGLVAPCCDDNTMFVCCCEQGGQACNIVRSGKGLTAQLILDAESDYTVEQIREAVLQWLRFARPDYYLAAELEARDIDPEGYGLTTYGSCYRGMCAVAISQGGCGGMDELIEPLLDL